MANAPTSFSGRSPAGVGAPSIVGPSTDAPQQGMIPFRRATTERIDQLQVITGTLGTTIQKNEQTIDGSGLLAGVDLDVQVTSSGNAAAVAFAEDAPYNILNSVVLHDVSGEVINLPGYSLYLANKYGGWTPGKPAETSADTNIYQLVSGTAANGGSFRFHLWAPTVWNRRTLMGLLGNQDRAQRYALRTDIDTLSTLYTTAPTAAPSFTLTKHYWNFAVPAAQNQFGIAQQQLPSTFGVLPFITQTTSESAPQGGSTVNHYIKRLGNTVRLIILVFRSNGSRATAEANLPTKIQLKLGDVTIFTETPAMRRRIMWDRYNFDAPAGVLVYDWTTDLDNRAGAELGDDWQWTQAIVQAQFAITYPSGFGSTNNSLTFVTLDMLVPAGVDPYAG